jgi:NAD-dependent dihydropyrimidine dehydrogenase PreA subunit
LPVPIDRNFRSNLRVSGIHRGHSIWTSKTDKACVVHGTFVGVHVASCTGCLKCINACPTVVLVPWTTDSGKEVVDPANEMECMACLACEVVCPADAISIQRSPGSAETLESLLHDV